MNRITRPPFSLGGKAWPPYCVAMTVGGGCDAHVRATSGRRSVLRNSMSQYCVHALLALIERDFYWKILMFAIKYFYLLLCVRMT